VRGLALRCAEADHSQKEQLAGHTETSAQAARAPREEGERIGLFGVSGVREREILTGRRFLRVTSSRAIQIPAEGSG
jgi:hypothetical protein